MKVHFDTATSKRQLETTRISRCGNAELAPPALLRTSLLQSISAALLDHLISGNKQFLRKR